MLCTYAQMTDICTVINTF